MKTAEIDLIEMVSEAIAGEFSKIYDSKYGVNIYTGKGNNGADGLAVARILAGWGYNVRVITLFDKELCTKENQYNLDRQPVNVRISGYSDFNPVRDENSVIIDAIFGSGYKGTMPEYIKYIINSINKSGNKVVSIDIPSGICGGFQQNNDAIIKADITLAVEIPAIALLLAENVQYTGRLIIVDAGIYEHEKALQKVPFDYINGKYVEGFASSREKFAYKNQFGHTLLICGGEGMTGAAVLATGAALRSGCGLVTVHLSKHESNVIHCTNPCAIVSIDPSPFFSSIPENISRYDSIGVGCGLGKKPETFNALHALMDAYDKPMVIDADAINIMASNPALIMKVPKHSVMTPHPGELKRLLGEWSNEADKYEKVRNFSMMTGIIVVVKGAYTQIYAPDGSLYVNSSGTPAMAKAGSGDVLTGLISGLMAKGLPPLKAAIFGVFIHGKAGEGAEACRGTESVNAQDIIDHIRF